MSHRSKARVADSLVTDALHLQLARSLRTRSSPRAGGDRSLRRVRHAGRAGPLHHSRHLRRSLLPRHHRPADACAVLPVRAVDLRPARGQARRRRPVRDERAEGRDQAHRRAQGRRRVARGHRCSCGRVPEATREQRLLAWPRALEHPALRQLPGGLPVQHRPALPARHRPASRRRQRARGPPCPSELACRSPAVPLRPARGRVYSALSLARPRYLQERILCSAPPTPCACSRASAEDAEVAFAWEHPQYAEFPEPIQTALQHARTFAEVMHGAALLYNLILADTLPAGASSDDQKERYRQALQSWSEELRARDAAIASWDRTAFWALLQSRARIKGSTRRFVEDWIALGTWRSGADASREARTLVQQREMAIKGARSRVASPRALELWTGASGVGRFDYRWRTASQLGARHPHRPRRQRCSRLTTARFCSTRYARRRVPRSTAPSPPPTASTSSRAPHGAAGLLAVRSPGRSRRGIDGRQRHVRSAACRPRARRASVGLLPGGGDPQAREVPPAVPLPRGVGGAGRSAVRRGVFHAKVGRPAFTRDGRCPRYRVIVPSRNLTFDSSWDTMLVLEGELKDRTRGIAMNHPLADLVAALAGLAVGSPHRADRERRRVKLIADELRRVEFELPSRAWRTVLAARHRRQAAMALRAADRQRMLIVSPFVTPSTPRAADRDRAKGARAAESGGGARSSWPTAGPGSFEQVSPCTKAPTPEPGR